MTRKTEKLHLVRTAFFKKVGDEVYVRNVATGEEFIFSAEAAPVFSALRKGALRDAPPVRGNAGFLRELDSFGLLDSSPDQRQTRSATPAPPEGTLSPDISAHFQEIRSRRHRLWSACLELTYRCNEKCSHCYVDISEEQTTVGELNASEWSSVIDQLARMGCMNILVTGGEPTLHPAFLSVCRRIVARGMLCDVYTNGLNISDDIFASLCELPLNSVSVSLYSGSEAFHDEVTGVPGSFRRTLASLLRFQAAGITVYAKTPMFRGHLDAVFSARKLGEKHGFAVKPANILVPGHSGASRNHMMLDSSEYKVFLERFSTPDPSVGSGRAQAERKNGPVCQAGISTLCISPTGDVMPCNSFQAKCGNVRDEHLSAIWRQSSLLRRLRALRFRDFSPRCSACPDIAFCSVCPGASWLETHGKFAPSSWSCGQTAVRSAFNKQPQGSPT